MLGVGLGVGSWIPIAIGMEVEGVIALRAMQSRKRRKEVIHALLIKVCRKKTT